MTIWYIARGAGFSALILLTVATAIGLLLGGRVPGSAHARVVLQYVHRTLAVLGLAVLGLHLTAILADSFARVGIVGAAIPFQSAYRASAIGFGSIAGYLFLLVAATGFLRVRMTRSAAATRVWRAIHALSYGGWALALLHGVRSGTDSAQPWARWIYVGCAAAVGTAVAVRTASRARPIVRGAGVRPTPRAAVTAR
jgi:predicted ferric reductase